MKNKYLKIISLIAVLILTFTLVACGNSSKTQAEPAAIEAEATTDEVAEPVAEAVAETIKLIVGASPSPHGEILNAAKPVLAQQGIELEIVEFSDYVLPNLSLEDGSLDANYFQHEPYLINFNEGNNANLVTAAFIHYEPLGVYPGKTASLAEIAEGAKIAVPNDATNEARALLLLEAQGLIKLKEGVGIEATPRDIEENKLNLEIIEVEASQTPSVLPDVDFAVVNSNFALSAGIINTVLTREDENSVAVEYANIIAVRSGDETRPEIIALVDALKSEDVKAFITENYKGAVIVFEG